MLPFSDDSAHARRVTAHLCQAVLREQGTQEHRGAVERVLLGRRGCGTGRGRQPMAHLVPFAGGEAAGGGRHRQRRDGGELVIGEVAEPTTQRLIASMSDV